MWRTVRGHIRMRIMRTTRYSASCHDPTTYWDASSSQCVLCTFRPGYEITPNCGYDDDGSRHDSPLKECKNGTFNDGTRAYCAPCTRCSAGYRSVKTCSSTADTECREIRASFTTQGSDRETTSSPTVPGRETTVPLTVSSVSRETSTEPGLSPQPFNPSYSSLPKDESLTTPHVLWTVPVILLVIIIAVLALSAFVIYMKRNRRLHCRGQPTERTYRRKLSYTNSGFSSLSASPGNDLEEILSPAILSAPLQAVLDDLDVLEELVILLDPESHGKKNTKHLASHCSFQSSWITYTYSMKDSKSPLKAVLEGVTSRQPEWTVKHLVKLLKHMERNDAIVALAKLRTNELDV